MLSMRLVPRANLSLYAATVQRLHTSTLLLETSSSSSSDSDKKDSKKRVKSKPVQTEEQMLKSRQETNDRMTSLLNSMMTKPVVSKPIDLAVHPKKPQHAPKQKQKRFEEKVIDATKDVAVSLGGDVKKTQSDLLNKLLSMQTEKLNDQQKEKSSEPATSITINELVAGMKVSRIPQKFVDVERSRSAEVRSAYKISNSDPSSKSVPGRYKKRDFIEVESGNLHSGDPLGIFDASQTSTETQDILRLKTWENMQKREFKLAITHPPENIFQEMILWTEEGKLWKFPIDNEQGMEEEQNVHFSEHVFMDRHLQDWCPKRGPIRHFMELVCVGLSKNPYMTVNEKKEHILWYREYFDSKQELLREIGAIEGNVSQPEQIEA